MPSTASQGVARNEGIPAAKGAFVCPSQDKRGACRTRSVARGDGGAGHGVFSQLSHCPKAKIPPNICLPAACPFLLTDIAVLTEGRKFGSSPVPRNKQLWQQELLSQTTFRVLWDANLISLEQGSE